VGAEAAVGGAADGVSGKWMPWIQLARKWRQMGMLRRSAFEVEESLGQAMPSADRRATPSVVSVEDFPPPWPDSSPVAGARCPEVSAQTCGSTRPAGNMQLRVDRGGVEEAAALVGSCSCSC